MKHYVWNNGDRWVTERMMPTPRGMAYVFENLSNNDVAIVSCYTGKRIHYTSKVCYVREQWLDRKELFNINRAKGFIDPIPESYSL